MSVLKPIVASVLAILVASGCSSRSTKQFVPLPDQTQRIDDPGKARIYVLRVSNLEPLDVGKVSDGDMPIGSLGADAYLCWEREPGEATLRSRWFGRRLSMASKESVYELRLSVAAGNVYYVMQQWRIREDTPTRLAVLNEDYGRKKLAECKPPVVVAK